MFAARGLLIGSVVLLCLLLCVNCHDINHHNKHSNKVRVSVSVELGGEDNESFHHGHHSSKNPSHHSSDASIDSASSSSPNDDVPYFPSASFWKSLFSSPSRLKAWVKNVLVPKIVKGAHLDLVKGVLQFSQDCLKMTPKPHFIPSGICGKTAQDLGEMSRFHSFSIHMLEGVIGKYTASKSNKFASVDDADEDSSSYAELDDAMSLKDFTIVTAAIDVVEVVVLIIVVVCFWPLLPAAIIEIGMGGAIVQGLMGVVSFDVFFGVITLVYNHLESL